MKPRFKTQIQQHEHRFIKFFDMWVVRIVFNRCASLFPRDGRYCLHFLRPHILKKITKYCFVRCGLWKSSRYPVLNVFGHISRPFLIVGSVSQRFCDGLPFCEVFDRTRVIASVGTVIAKLTELALHLNNAIYAILVPYWQVSSPSSL